MCPEEPKPKPLIKPAGQVVNQRCSPRQPPPQDLLKGVPARTAIKMGSNRRQHRVETIREPSLFQSKRRDKVQGGRRGSGDNDRVPVALTVGTYSEGNLLVVYEMSRQV